MAAEIEAAEAYCNEEENKLKMARLEHTKERKLHKLALDLQECNTMTGDLRALNDAVLMILNDDWIDNLRSARVAQYLLKTKPYG